MITAHKRKEHFLYIFFSCQIVIIYKCVELYKQGKDVG